jgi:hypothetical protein
LVLSSVLGDERVDLSKTARLVVVLSGPHRPFGHLCGQARASLSDQLDDAFGAAHDSCSPVESRLSLLAVAAPGQAAMTAECFERFLSSSPFLTGPGELGSDPLLVFLERVAG